MNEARLETLKNLVKERIPSPNEAEQVLSRMLMRHGLQDKVLGKIANPKTTTGLEIETFASRHHTKKLPYENIARVEAAGIKRDRNDSFRVGSTVKKNKWEAALEHSHGAYQLLMREVVELIHHGVITLHKRKKRTNEYYPLHTTVFGIKRDFPSSNHRPDFIHIVRVVNSDGTITKSAPLDESKYRTKLEAWNSGSLTESWVRKHKLSDCFLLIRGLDATQYVTSPERIRSVFEKNEPGDPFKGYLDKGYSGVNIKRDETTGDELDMLELRTGELWGNQSLKGLGAHLRSLEFLVDALIPFQKLPMAVRDEIWSFDISGNFETSDRILVQNLDDTELELAQVWLNYRRAIIQLYEKYHLPNPAGEYWREEFEALADTMSDDEFTKEARKILLGARRAIKKLTQKT